MYLPPRSEQALFEATTPLCPALEVPLLSTIATMGEGCDQIDGDIIVDVLRLSHKWVDDTVRPLSASKNLCFIHADGDSMHPTLEPGDILLVDVATRSAQSNGGLCSVCATATTR